MRHGADFHFLDRRRFGAVEPLSSFRKSPFGNRRKRDAAAQTVRCLCASISAVRGRAMRCRGWNSTRKSPPRILCDSVKLLYTTVLNPDAAPAYSALENPPAFGNMAAKLRV
jgi:hypothetical protein